MNLPPPPFWTKVGDLNREINIQGPYRRRSTAKQAYVR